MSDHKPTPEMPVVVFGVDDGNLVPQGRWQGGYAPKQEFLDLADAQKAFPDLSMDCTDNTRFVGPHLDSRAGRERMRFDTREHYNWIMRE